MTVSEDEHESLPNQDQDQGPDAKVCCAANQQSIVSVSECTGKETELTRIIDR